MLQSIRFHLQKLSSKPKSFIYSKPSFLLRGIYMQFLLAALLVISTSAISITSEASEFSQRSCEQYQRNSEYSKALDTIASRMKYTSRSELCSLPHLFDVHITNSLIYNMEKGVDEAHVWITLHYAEHSCQYFVKIEDQSVTKKNCYNTF